MIRDHGHWNYWEDPDPHGLDKCEHGKPLDESCEDCLLDAASDRMDAGQAVAPELVKAVNQRDWERRR